MDWLLDSPFALWLAIGAALLAVEVASGSGWLLWPAGSAAVMGLIGLVVHLDLTMQLVIFALLTIATTLAGDGYTVARLAGADRYATAVAVAAALGNPTTVFEADGTNFPDALSAGTAATQQGAVVLLTSGSKMPAGSSWRKSAAPRRWAGASGPPSRTHLPPSWRGSSPR